MTIVTYCAKKDPTKRMRLTQIVKQLESLAYPDRYQHMYVRIRKDLDASEDEEEKEMQKEKEMA